MQLMRYDKVVHTNDDPVNGGKQGMSRKAGLEYPTLPFGRTLWQDPDLPGPMFDLRGTIVGHEAFHELRRTLALGFEIAGADESAGFDLTRIAVIDDLNVAQFALAVGNRVLVGGKCRYIIPQVAWGQLLVTLAGRFGRQVSSTPESVILDF